MAAQQNIQPAARAPLSIGPSDLAALCAVSLGEPQRWYELGLSYSTGDGAPLDYVTAHAWFNLAAQAGHGEARTMRAELSQDMSAAEVAQAQSLARAWANRPH